MDHQNYVNMARVQDRHWWFRGKRALLRRVLSRLELPEAARILDAGCGTGANMKMLSEFGQVWGMEYDDFALEIAGKISGATVARGFLPGDIPFGSQSFHLVTVLDVLSCIEADGAAIKALADRMVPGGWLVITAPAFDFLFSSHDLASHHHRRYTIPRLVSVVESQGLEVSFSSYFNTLLFLPIVFVRLMKKWLRLLEGDDVGVLPPAWINTVLSVIFRLESRVVGWGWSLPFGVSAVLVAQKPMAKGGGS
ncbi:MAG: Class I SAM-dependent methyltransferase [Magnetococcales bacterium]|nr:Class I SAM-dependent methyltransferase [Magnetococcales bacterium]HIJ84299.1 class I SAM-dependent methyltransferase [Magnetococcales bacterium]